MKIVRFHIENYRGIRDAQARDLVSFPYVVLTGRNGTGKSLILEALAAIWAGEINLPDLVGPYANSLSVELAIELSPEEYTILDDWLDEIGQERSERQPEHVVRAIATSAQETGQYAERDRVIEALQNRHFADKYTFANLDLLSARRQPTLEAEIGVDLNLLDAGQNALQRRQMMQEEIRWKIAQVMPDVGSYLTALDYREYVASRSGRGINDEYYRLQEVFSRATGKNISRPDFDFYTGRPEISVTIPSGIKHGLADLSNGEREMIGMFYYISQLASRGGVLLLDEPEKHLHPSLQAAVLEAINSLAGQGQALIVTHSPNIVATVPQDQICSVSGAWETSGNQLKWASDSQDSFEPLIEIGISPRDVLQMEALLVVEGPGDGKRLRMLFPEGLARVKVIEAGGRSQVMRIAEALDRVDIGIPHLCVVDRDYLSANEVTRLEAKGIFVWRARMIENVLLSVPLIAAVTFREEEDIERVLRSCAGRLRNDAIVVFGDQRVLQLLLNHSGDSSNGVADYLQQQIDTWSERQRQQEKIQEDVRREIESIWDTSYELYVDGKKLMGVMQAELDIFRNRETLSEMLVIAARSNSKLMPPEFARFDEQLSSLIASPSARTATVAIADLGNLDSRVKSLLSRAEPNSRLNSSDTDFGDSFKC